MSLEPFALGCEDIAQGGAGLEPESSKGENKRTLNRAPALKTSQEKALEEKNCTLLRSNRNSQNPAAEQ